jgi:hypothetical protein
MQNRSSRRVVVLDPVSDLRWFRLIRSHSGAGFFHHPDWLALLAHYYKFNIFALCVEQGGDLIAGIPFCEVGSFALRQRKWVCLPFSDHCGPLGLSPEDGERLVDHAIARAQALGIRLEIRHPLRADSGCEASSDHWLHVLDLGPEPERLMKRFKSVVQRSIRKAQKNDLTTELRRDTEAVDIFYRLHLKTRRKQGVPIQPRGFFTLFDEYILQRDLGFITLTRSKAGYISAGVFCCFHGTITYKYGASDPACLDLAPNHLMFWHTMLHARRHGFTRFDFGKTALSNAGLRFFKRGWDTKETELSYSHFPTAPSPGLVAWVNRKVVEPVIRHSPEIVCRMAGEALYKHFGT